MKKLAIVTTHPIQYNAPIFALLSSRKNIEIKVFYTWGEGVLNRKFDPGFNRVVVWDIPLLEGYPYEWVNNVSKAPGSHHFKGIDNPGIVSQIERFKPDALLIFGWSFRSHLRCLRYFHHKIPVLFRGDSTTFNLQRGLKKFVRRLFLNWVYRHIDYALYVGTKNKEYYVENGLKNHQLIPAFHAVDNFRFGHPSSSYALSAAEWKEQLKIKPDDVVILFAGKLEPIKNPSFYIQLAEMCKGLPLTFLVVGNGPLENEIKAKASHLPSVIFIDFQNQLKMPVVYRLADVLIMCSYSETWGLAANEAMASGCIVMLADTTGAAVDLVKEGSTGIVFQLEHPEKCVSFIQTLCGHPEKINQMKEQAYQHIQDFNFEQVAAAIEKVVM